MSKTNFFQQLKINCAYWVSINKITPREIEDIYYLQEEQMSDINVFIKYKNERIPLCIKVNSITEALCYCTLLNNEWDLTE